MDVVYGLIPFVLMFGFIAVVVFIWMAKRGQFDDLDRAAHQIFLDDDEEPTLEKTMQRDGLKAKKNTVSQPKESKSE